MGTALFTHFPLLPLELRLCIWRIALPGPRTIHIYDEVSIRQVKASVRCPRIVTILLQVCRESRAEVLQHYRPIFEPEPGNESRFRLHFFDPLIDGIFVDQVWPWIGTTSRPSGLCNTRKLSIGCNAWWYMWRYEDSRNLLFGKLGLMQFTCLEELTIVFRVMTEEERRRDNSSWAPRGDLSCTPSTWHRHSFLRFAYDDVDVRVEPIIERLEMVGKANPTWNVPKVKVVAWAQANPGMTIKGP